VDLTKPSKKCTNWGAQLGQRSNTIEGGNRTVNVPGPGEYNLASDTIQMKQIKNLMQHEAQYEKEKGAGNFNVLSKKLTIKPNS